MKKLIYLLLAVLLSTGTNAQEPTPSKPKRPGMQQMKGKNRMARPNKEKIELYKVQFITQKLSLTKEEAEAFWPIYEANKKEMHEIIKNKSVDEIETQEALLKTKKKYKNNLTPVLKTEDRINHALRLEREFLHKMRYEMMRRKGTHS